MWIKIIQILFFQTIFIVVYDLWLQKETFFTINRIYLLGTSFLAVLIPFLSFSLESIPKDQSYLLQEVVLNTQNIQLPEVVLTVGKNIDKLPYPLWIYLIGLFLFSSILMWKLIKLFRLMNKSTKQQRNGFTLVKIANSNQVFSFLNYVFIGDEIKENTYIIKHEKVHIIQKHSWDLLWFEFLKVVFWFNPLIYIYQKRMLVLHEFIADAISIKQMKKNYYNHLLNGLFQVNDIHFVNEFYNQLTLKKRIIMMRKNKSKTWKHLKYLILYPITLGMLVISIRLNAQEAGVHDKKAWDEVKEILNVLNTKNEITKEKLMRYKVLVKRVSQDSLVKLERKLLPKNVIEGTIDSIDVEAVPFSQIDVAPIFPGCENIPDNLVQRDCFEISIVKFVSENFDIKIAQNLDLTPGKKRIYTKFLINKEGEIKNIEAKAAHEVLNNEAIRVLKSLPKMTPGKHKNVKVGVKYSLPISFVISDDTAKSKLSLPKYVNQKKSKKKDEKKLVPFATIDQAPIYPGCEALLTKKDQRNCLSQKIKTHVINNFNLSLAKNLGLSPGLKRLYVMFVIDENGNVSGIRARGPHLDLEQEAVRVIRTLPKMIPGRQENQPIGVKYALPISFMVD